MSKEELRTKLRRLMETFGMTISFIADTIGYDRAYVHRFINDKIAGCNTINLEKALEQFYYERIRLWNKIQS